MRNDPYSRYRALQQLAHDLYGFSHDCPNAKEAESLSATIFTYARTNGSGISDGSVLKLLSQIRPLMRRILENQNIDIHRPSFDSETSELTRLYSNISDQIDELTPRFEHMVQFKAQLSAILTDLRQILQISGDRSFIGARAANAFSELTQYSLWIQLQLRLDEDAEQKLNQLIENFLKQCEDLNRPDILEDVQIKLDQLRVLYLLEEVSR